MFLHKVHFSALIVVPESSNLYISGHLYTQPRQTGIRSSHEMKVTEKVSEMRYKKSVLTEIIQNSIERYILNP